MGVVRMSAVAFGFFLGDVQELYAPGIEKNVFFGLLGVFWAFSRLREDFHEKQ